MELRSYEITKDSLEGNGGCLDAGSWVLGCCVGFRVGFGPLSLQSILMSGCAPWIKVKGMLNQKQIIDSRIDFKPCLASHKFFTIFVYFVYLCTQRCKHSNSAEQIALSFRELSFHILQNLPLPSLSGYISYIRGKNGYE